MLPGEQARLVLTDEPYNVPNVGHVTSQAHHREFAMAAGEMSREEFGAFNRAWMSSAASYVVDGGLIMTFIDWRSVELVLACGRDLELELVNIVVWSKSNAGQGSLWRSQHELLPVLKKGSAPALNNVELGRFGRWRSNVWCYPGASSVGSDAREGLAVHPTVKPRVLLEDALLDVSDRGEIVLEPFAGSGSTLIAAEATDRVCRAIEIDGQLLRRRHPPLAEVDRRRGCPRADRRDPHDRRGPALARGRGLMVKSKPKSSGPSGPHEVGYGRPPGHSRFQPGQSGNPAGRRKGQPTVGETLMKEAARLVKIKRGDTVETITKHEVVIRRLFQSAMEGDIAASRLVLFGLAQNAPEPSDAPVEDETANLALGATPDDETVRRMLARFAHLHPNEGDGDT